MMPEVSLGIALISTVGLRHAADRDDDVVEVDALELP